MISELMFFAVSVFVLKKYYKRKNNNFNDSIRTLHRAIETVNFNDSIRTLHRAVETVVKDKKIKMASGYNFTGNYVPKYTPPEKRDFLTYLDDLQYQKFEENPDKYMKNVKIINFDLIHHQCRGDRLQHSEEHYQTIFEKNLVRHKKEDKKLIAGSGLRTQKELQQPIYFEKKVIKDHFSV